MNNKIKTIIFRIVYPFFYLYYKRIQKQFPQVLDTKRTLKKLIEENRSLSRFGDGEFGLISGKSIGFQVKDQALANELMRVLESSNDNCLIGIPDVFNGFSRFRIEARCFWLFSVVKNWHKWKSFLRKRTYADSLCSRFYMDLEEKSESLKILSLWKKLWTDREIIIVEGEHTKMGVGNDLFDSAKSIKRIICPSKDAFRVYKKILDTTSQVNKTSLILVALGPTASILAFDLSCKGYQAIDTGHLDLEYNWLMKKSQKKESVDGRLVNELSNSSFKEITDAKYEEQILERL